MIGQMHGAQVRFAHSSTKDSDGRGRLTVVGDWIIPFKQLPRSATSTNEDFVPSSVGKSERMTFGSWSKEENSNPALKQISNTGETI
jgi:hypothetical protein